jgi:hypothetical protein
MYLAASAVATGNGSALSRSGRLVVLLDILGGRWWLLAIVWWRRSACPLVGAWQTVWLLVLVLRMLGHVGAGLLGRWRWRWERGVHLG